MDAHIFTGIHNLHNEPCILFALAPQHLAHIEELMRAQCYTCSPCSLFHLAVTP